MSTGAWHAGGEVLLGGYDPRKREQEVVSRLEHFFEAIRKKNLHKQVGGDGQAKSAVGSKARVDKDVISIQLSTILEEVDQLEKNVEAFVGPHFTKNYRTLQGDCTKFQSDLDRLEVKGRDDIRAERRKTIIRIDALAKKLAGKAHLDGKSCPRCEVQD